MILLYLLCGFTIVSSGILGYYWHQLELPPPSKLPQSKPRVVYQVNACKVGSTALLIPQGEWVSPQTNTLLINGCIYTIKTTERSAEFVKIQLDQTFLNMFGEGLQDITFDKWFKLHLLD